MANTKCPARYKNLGLETFGNKKKVTEEILKQFCKNDEWLRQNVEELRYLSPPAVRKSLRISETIDMDKSWGCMVNSQNNIQFSNLTETSFSIDLTSEEGLNQWIDSVQSQTNSGSTSSTDGSSKFSYIQLPSTVVEGEEKAFGTAEMYNGYNSAWYVGFNKSKNFYLKPKWIKNWKSINLDDPKDRIPAVARAQTFTVPEGFEGELVHLDIQLEYNGLPTLSSSPLHVQIWDTYQGWVNKTKWNNSTKLLEKEYETIATSKRENNISELPSDWKKYKQIKVYEKDKKGNPIYTNKKQTKQKYHYKYKESNTGNYVVAKRKVAKPRSRHGKTITKPLAEETYNPTSTVKGGQVTITFKNPPKLQAGKQYAIVLLSPLNNWENCPRWCGWGRNCKRDKSGRVVGGGESTYYEGNVYTGGDAFFSTDNGISWKRYGGKGKTEGITEYKQGKYAPQDYRFRCRMKVSEDTVVYPTDEIHYAYFKPIYSNPITQVTISPSGRGTDNTSRSEGAFVDFQLSTDGDNWTDFGSNNTINLSEPSRVIFLRALLSSEHENDTPKLEKVHVDLKMNLPDEMYARTKPYTPEKFGTILGASVWGRVYAPYTVDNEFVDCKVDVIQTREDSEYFDIVDIDTLDEKLNEININSEWLIEHEESESRAEYLSQHVEVLNALKNNYNIYILPYEAEDKMYNLSFAPSEDKLIVYPSSTTNGEDEEENEVAVNVYPDEIGGISLIKEVAYPVISCQLEPEDGEGHGEVASYGEWYDYRFDYQNNDLIFKRDTLNRMANGTLIVTYNPVFIKDLTNNEVGIHFDEDGNQIDGLILDYFKEKFTITGSGVTRVKLKVDAVDPIRQVYLYTTTNDEPISLKEDTDYYYDIDTHELVFEVLSLTTMDTMLNEGDVLEVVYTPNLDDTSICIGYNATRTDLNSDCYIDDYYIEYKV